MKKCTKCGIKKKLNEFYEAKSCKNNISASCKICNNTEDKERLKKEAVVTLYGLYVDGELAYVGCTKNFKASLRSYHSQSYNEKSRAYNCLVNTYIRNQGWNLEDIRSNFKPIETYKNDGLERAKFDKAKFMYNLKLNLNDIYNISSGYCIEKTKNRFRVAPYIKYKNVFLCYTKTEEEAIQVVKNFKCWYYSLTFEKYQEVTKLSIKQIREMFRGENSPTN